MKLPTVLCCCWVLLLVAVCDGQNATSQYHSDYLESLKQLDGILKRYDRRMLPTYNKPDTPTVVACEFYIRSIGSIDPLTMDYQVDLYLRQSWFDGRLRNDNLSKALDLSDPKLVQSVWKPEVFFSNAKHASFQYVAVPNVMLRIHPDGNVLYMLRLKLIFSCMMDISKYPFDSQTCTMDLASFSKTTSELVLAWIPENPVKLTQSLKLPQYDIIGVTTENCKATFHIGEFSCIVAKLHLKRSIAYHMLDSYLPTILMVIISWLSFWLDVKATPARVTLGITTLLAMTFKGGTIQDGLPQVSYVKAIDVWIGTCTAFVFAAALEFIFVNYMCRRQAATAVVRQSKVLAVSDSVECGERKLEQQNGQGKLEDALIDVKPSLCHVDNEGYARRFDNVCRVAFPMVFLCFNIFYWPYYLSP